MKIIDHLKTDWIRYGFESAAVIIGILLAFALDNWNEEHKTQILTRNLLMEVKQNLQRDVVYFQSRAGYQQDHIDEIDILIRQIETRAPYYDSLKYLFVKVTWITEFSVVSSAYETLKSVGIEKIRSPELRKWIANQYDVRYHIAEKRIDRVSDLMMNQGMEFDRYFRNLGDEEGMIPVDYEALLNDPAYLNYLYKKKAWKKNYIGFLDGFTHQAERLITMIDEELAK